MSIRWRGRDWRPKEQVANAWDSAIDLTPVSDAPADAVKAAWLPMQAGQDIPLIGREQRDEQVRQDDPDEFWSR